MIQGFELVEWLTPEEYAEQAAEEYAYAWASCPQCIHGRVEYAETWDGDYESGPDIVTYCICCGWEDYI